MIMYYLVIALVSVIISKYWLVPKIKAWSEKEVARASKDPVTQDIFQEKKPD